jgi:fructose-bisphosphate aldolase class II
MIDASKEDFETNIAITSRVVKAAHERYFGGSRARTGRRAEDHIHVEHSNAKLTNPARPLNL